MRIGRIVRPIDFERTLATPTRSRSAHFAAHHLAEPPAASVKARDGAATPELSTDVAQSVPQAVDDNCGGCCWLGIVVPKRHARRSVTRSMLKRQIRAAMDRHRGRLRSGLWVVRLKGGFDRQRFPAAASDALKRVVAGELDELLSRAARPMRQVSA